MRLPLYPLPFFQGWVNFKCWLVDQFYLLVDNRGSSRPERGHRRAPYAGRGTERQLGGPRSDPSEHKRLRRWGWTPPDGAPAEEDADGVTG